MNPVTNEEPLKTLEKFKGLWARGGQDTCPPDHLTDCFNCIFPSNEQITIRERFTIQSNIAGRQTQSFAIAQVPAGPILLTLDISGEFWDETHGSLLTTVGGADDFSILNIFGRTYITFKLRGRAYPDKPICVYDGVTFRPTGWPRPATPPSGIQSTTGVVDAGVHSFAIVYQSPSGFLSGPSPTVAVSADGSHNILLSSIPIGPPGTVARWVLATRANESELFFVPNGNIGSVEFPDNTTTSFQFTSPDTALIASADYLRDIYDELPGCAALKFYRGRMVCIGKYSAPDDILISRQQDPETVSLVENVVHLPVNYGISTSVGGLVIRAVLYITKPNATYSVQDNGGDPNTWGVDCVDSGIGAYDVGLSMFASDMSAQDVADSSLVCNKRGLMYFTGQYTDIPLTYKIETIWQLIDENNFYKVQIAHDTWLKRVYIAVPLDPPTIEGDPIGRGPSGQNNLILMMDYTEGLNPATVQWSTWKGNNTPYRKIAVENFTLDTYSTPTIVYQLATCNGSTAIWKLTVPQDSVPVPLPDVMPSGHTMIWQFITTPYVGGPQGLFTFKMLDISIAGYGIMGIKLWGSKRDISTHARGFDLSFYGNKDLQRLINFMGESMAVTLVADTNLPDGFSGFMTLDSVKIFGYQTYNMRPALTETY